MTYFPFAEYWWFYLGFTIFVLGMLALDLGVFNRKAHAISYREAATWTTVCVLLALAFNFGFYQYASWKLSEPIARQLGLEFLTGYLVEYALSLDNLFVFVVIFNYFGISATHQHRILFYGILGALVFRALFIGMGSILMQYDWVIVLFGVFLILTGVKMMFAPEKEIEPEKNPIIRLVRRFMPVASEAKGHEFIIRVHGKLYGTPLLLVLLFIEMSDIVFAIDSVPAIFALTREPLIVFTSNIFAILGLRSLFFLLARAVSQFYLLKYGLGIVLVFVGLKMAWLNHVFGGHFPIGWSLGVIGGTIGASIVASLLFPKPVPSAVETLPLVLQSTPCDRDQASLLPPPR